MITSWQDIVITAASVGFAYSLIHQVIIGFKIKKCTISMQTALITVLGLAALAVAYFSLSLMFAFASSLVAGSMWGVLLWQSVTYGRGE